MNSASFPLSYGQNPSIIEQVEEEKRDFLINYLLIARIEKGSFVKRLKNEPMYMG